MSVVHGEFRESSAMPRTRSLPLSHLSVELGHLYMEDFQAGPERLRTLFAEAKPWAEAAERSAGAWDDRPRVSTCFLVDDYFSDLHPPSVVMPALLAAAQEAGVRIDYLVRESACAVLDGPAGRVSPADLLVARMVREPPPGTTGSRPPAAQSGWLANGQRSPDPGRAAMDVPTEWQPPAQNAARRHSIFVDVQLWDGDPPDRTWSCALLAAVWQLLRLGLLRHLGEPVAEPLPRPAEWPAEWQQVPPVVRLHERAQPFAAYSTTSILSARFLPVEIAVRTILGQVASDPAVTAQLEDRAGSEEVPFPPDLLDRIGYVFAGSGRVDPA